MSDKELIKASMMLDYSQLVMNNVYCHKEIEKLNKIIEKIVGLILPIKEY